MSIEVASSQSRFRLPTPPTHLPRPRLPPPCGFVLPKLPALSHDIHLLGSGLRTPPWDDMSATYQPAPSPYDAHSLQSSYPNALVHAARLRAFSVSSSDSRSNSQHDRLSQSHSTLPSSSAVLALYEPNIPAPTPMTSSSSLACFPETASPSKNPADSLIYHSLRIPKCISPNGGHLPEFAAQMTCLFWFESCDELKAAGSTKPRPSNNPFPRLPELARPHDQFRKWVSSVLSTTQVTQNVVLLALLFIYRLKLSTPQIMGRGGSEYRLLTVALMLANKCKWFLVLDDNTYTNKTWAEVSSFAVSEIHVMEVEFLSNMRYNLLVSKAEWEDWLEKLARFHRHYEWASKAPPSPVCISSPSPRGYTSPVQSPSAVSFPGADIPAYAPFSPAGTMHSTPDSNRYIRDWAAHDQPLSPLASKPPSLKSFLSRKRSPETDLVEHQAKRQMMPLKSAPNYAAYKPMAVAESTRLPIPHLSVITGQESSRAAPYSLTSAYTSQPTSAAPTSVSLPPPQLGMRTVPVYQPVAPIASQPAMTPTGPADATSSGYSNTCCAPFPYHAPNKVRSPGSLAAYASSPLVEPPQIPPSSGVHTPMSHTPISQSPSVYLQQRTSPYRPIRHVDRLLYPPPSTSLDQYHLPVPVQPAQMHYQPIGRPNDLRPGIVPEFVIFNGSQHHRTPASGGPQGVLVP